MRILAFTTAALLGSAVAYGAAHAQVAYTNSALNGCYAIHSSSVDTGATTTGSALVGTMCFDGKGKIVGTADKPALSGHVENADGTAYYASDQTGTYTVTNSPGDGMGRFEGSCALHAFVLRRVKDGLAEGFDYVLTKKKKACPNGPTIAAGEGRYQGPLK
jgi:hypothetical protein